MLTRTSGGITTTFLWDSKDRIRDLTPEGQQACFRHEGEVVFRRDYGAWGETLPGGFDNVPGGMPYAFVGGLGVRTDADTGMAYMRQRWYDPHLQRFISRDPIGLEGGVNLYSYVGGNPVAWVDPMGLHFPGSDYCRHIEDRLRSNRKEIDDRIQELNENKLNQPYDCPGKDLRDTVMGHLLLLDLHYGNLKYWTAKWFQFNCGSHPPDGILGPVADLKPRIVKGDVTAPSSIYLPSPWWGPDGQALPTLDVDRPRMIPGSSSGGHSPESFPITLPQGTRVPRPVTQIQKPGRSRLFVPRPLRVAK